MKIHRSHPAKGFTIIPDATLRDPRLSYEERGVLVELLSRPDDWETNADALAVAARRQRGNVGEGKRKLRAAFAALEAAGYMRRIPVRRPGGRVATEIHLYDTSQAEDAPSGTSVLPAQTRIVAGHTDVPHGWYVGNSPADDHTGDTSVPPAKTRKTAGRTDVPLTDDHTGDTSVPPAKTHVSAGRTDDHTGGTSLRSTEYEEPNTKRSLSARLEQIVASATDATPDQARETAAAILREHKPDHPISYFRTLSKNGDLDLWLDKVRSMGGGSSVSREIGVRPQTQACRSGSHPGRHDTPCMAWCSCQCHHLGAMAS